jgi:hypothetical protein
MALQPTAVPTPAAQPPGPDLDELYGGLVKPNACDDLEKRTRPRSRERLDTDAAKRLKALMKATDQGLGVSRYTYCELPILWVADKDGEVWFGLEQIVDEGTQEFMLPRLRQTAVAAGRKRLGHPAFLASDDPDAKTTVKTENL